MAPITRNRELSESIGTRVCLTIHSTGGLALAQTADRALAADLEDQSTSLVTGRADLAIDLVRAMCQQRQPIDPGRFIDQAIPGTTPGRHTDPAIRGTVLGRATGQATAVIGPPLADFDPPQAAFDPLQAAFDPPQAAFDPLQAAFDRLQVASAVREWVADVKTPGTEVPSDRFLWNRTGPSGPVSQLDIAVSYYLNIFEYLTP
jgi:hypothetical protein